jgi:hypothetical protein
MMAVYGRNMLREEGGLIVGCIGNGKNILHEINNILMQQDA